MGKIASARPFSNELAELQDSATVRRDASSKSKPLVSMLVWLQVMNYRSNIRAYIAMYFVS